MTTRQLFAHPQTAHRPAIRAEHIPIFTASQASTRTTRFIQLDAPAATASAATFIAANRPAATAIITTTVAGAGCDARTRRIKRFDGA